MKVGTFLLLVLSILVISCTPQPMTTADPSPLPPDTIVTSPPEDDMPTKEPFVNPFAPKAGDENLTRGNVFLSETSLVIRESFPPQISLSLSGDLPTPCHQLRVKIPSPDQENKIAVDVYTVVDPNKVCAQVLEPFEEHISLGTFPSGHYSVWVNGELVGEFDS
jgi:hypothetical protein